MVRLRRVKFIHYQGDSDRAFRFARDMLGPLEACEVRVKPMKTKAILFIAPTDELLLVLDEHIRKLYDCIVVSEGTISELGEVPSDIHLLIVTGYSLQTQIRKIPGLSQLLAGLPERLPRLYVLQETDPSLSLVPFRGEQRFYYLRGAISSRNLRSAIDRILAMKPRPVRVSVVPELGINVRFHVRPRRHATMRIQRDVDEISSNGLSFLWRTSEPLLYPGDELEGLELRAHDHTFLRCLGRVKHVTPVRENGRVSGLRIGIEVAEPVLSTTEVNEVRNISFLNEPVVISSILADAVERRTEVLVKGESASWELRGHLLEAQDRVGTAKIQLNAEVGLPDELTLHDIMTCQFVRDNAQLQFSAVLLAIDDQELTLTCRIPRRLDRLWARSSLRYTYEGEHVPYVDVYTAISPQTPMHRPVLNLSAMGLSFWAEPDADILFRGMALDRVELRLPDSPVLTLKAEVRYLGPQSSDGTTASIPCGIQFRDVSPSDHHRLVTYLIAHSFPRVRDAGRDDEMNLWNFLQDGGFYTPDKQQSCLGSVAMVRETQARMLAAPTTISRKLIYEDAGRIYGTVSLQQIYQHTWLVHHLCAVRHRAEFVPKSLLLFLGEYISKVPEIHYIKMLWRPNNVWSNKIFSRLVHRLHDGERSVVKSYHYLHWEAGRLPDRLKGESDWDIHPLRGDEVVELESYFINKEEFFFMQSEDLIRGDLELSGLDARYRALGLYRERRVLGAFAGGTLAGFVLIENSSAGLNLSNLLNTFQVHVCIDDPEASHLLKRALIRSAIQYYFRRGQSGAVALTEDSNLVAYEEMGFQWIKEYLSWTFDHNIANIYNLYCYYIFRIYERLEAEREKRRAHIDVDAAMVGA